MIVHQINLRTADPSTNSPVAILVGLDGWHLTRDQLRAMVDPKLAFDRRGAHWTFDPISYYSFIKQLSEPISGSRIIKAPSFDHALKDPIPESIDILANHRIVIIEGLYVLLTEKGWKEAADLLDERWLIDVDVEEARRRLLKRHVITGVAADETEAVWRVDNNDMPS
jgi:pantothenate kinase